MRQKLTEKLLQNIFAFSTNAITSKVFIIFLCNKRQWKSNKFFFLLIYSFIYFRQTLIPKCASIIQSVCIQSKGRHTGTNLIDPSETGRHVRISLREEIQRYCQGKFLSMAILRGMSFSPKSWLLGYSTGARLVTCLGKNCPVITPTQKDSKMSFTPSQNPRPRQLDHSAEILHSSMRLIFATTYSDEECG